MVLMRTCVIKYSQFVFYRITNAVTTWILQELLSSTDPRVRQMADSHDWYIFPVVNPDGYAYTHDTVKYATKELQCLKVIFLE